MKVLTILVALTAATSCAYGARSTQSPDQQIVCSQRACRPIPVGCHSGRRGTHGSNPKMRCR
jgi:hypothetical protein